MKANLTDTIKRVLSDESDVRAANAAYDREFPYERDDEAQVTRREFCGFLGLTSTALFAGAAGFAGKAVYDARQPENFAPLRIDGAAALERNSALNFHYPTAREPALLIRANDGNYYAYGQKCTHLSCPVYYSAATARIECPCHEAGFETATGKVLYGPPPRALDRIELELRNGEVWAVGKKVGGRDESNG
ncbi:MAG: Rieske (2Fe-2S) protein [Acidobacteria bacterium]|nr:Rieske (2Fe-2S) protein [Acidobacteriota bacterium]